MGEVTKKVMKVRRSSTTGHIIEGASRIVAAPSMNKTRMKVAAGSIAGDWRAVGSDLRKSMRSAAGRLDPA